MGYFTAYNLLVKDINTGSIADPVDLIKQLESRYGVCDVFKDDGTWDNHSKWYDCEKDMTDFSLLYPNYLFELNGIGEDREDIWRAWFLNGKKQKEMATVTITHGSFDMDKLK
jgi:hypothetical protein